MYPPHHTSTHSVNILFLFVIVLFNHELEYKFPIYGKNQKYRKTSSPQHFATNAPIRRRAAINSNKSLRYKQKGV